MTEEAFIFPLSFAQQRLWFLDQLIPGNTFYNLPFALHFKEPLNRGLLERSLNEIMRRHEALRTSFATVDGQPMQVVAPHRTLSLTSVDLRDLPAGERRAEALRRANEEAWRPFDLSRGPLMRASLFQLGQTEHILLLILHHIVADDWSMRLLHEELTTLYGAFLRGLPSPLPELPIQYADYAVWQREWLQGEVLEAQLSYWKRQLEGIVPLQLPTDYPRPPVQSFRGASHFFMLPQPLAAALNALSQQRGATLFMTLLAAFFVLLQRHTQQGDLVIGLPIAGRNTPEVERLIGFFVNTLVLRLDLSDDPSFLTLLGRVRELAIDAYAHQDLPFEMLVEELQPERDLSHNPLFQVTFQLLKGPAHAGAPHPAADDSALEIKKESAVFDLAFNLWESADGLAGRVEYSTDLFSAETVERLTRQFQIVLEGIVASPAQRVSELPLLTSAERQQILCDWNATQAPFADGVPIHRLFEDVAARRADATAIAFEGGRLTYRELNTRANQLARHLRAHGVGPEVLVGICLERSPEMVLSLLAVLKAGGAYVPLDPTYPRNRLSYMIEDARAAVLLTQKRLTEKLPAGRATVICLDEEREQLARLSAENLAHAADAENAAYVIYTSGSTGRPKGVVVAHRGLCNLAATQIRICQVRRDSVVLQFASFSFDASVSEIFMSLLAGATLYLAGQDALMPGPALVELLREQAITTVTLAPSVLALLPVEELSTLRTIIVAGEACSEEVNALCAPGRQVFNAYGPTEATVCATIAQCSAEGGKPPIGRPISNMRVHILDPRLQPVPPGVPGELHIGGVGLARGYLNRPDLTAVKFIPDPFAAEPGARLYRTGDAARYLVDGNIEFLGRLDQQVKIRGFRIELEEIEAVLAQHPDVEQALVLFYEKTPGDYHLRACVVARPETTLAADDLRAFLREHLPQYMIPSSFVFQPALPLLPNGKPDRRAHQELFEEEPRETYVEPGTELERVIAEVWAEVLRLERVSTRDNFFDVGGHSLLMVKVQSRLRETLNREIPMTELFKYPTVNSLAQHLNNGQSNGAAQERIQSRVEKQKAALQRRRQLVQEEQAQ